MLTNDELLILHNFKDSLSTVRHKQLLEQLLFEYEELRNAVQNIREEAAKPKTKKHGSPRKRLKEKEEK